MNDKMKAPLLVLVTTTLLACGGETNPATTSCGDGVIDDGETCDSAELGGATCESLGFASGALACNAECTGFDTSACPCSPVTCATAGAECGPVDDGCGGTLDCGDACADQELWFTCGGGGTANTCGGTCELACPDGSGCNDDGVCSFTPTVPLDTQAHTVTFRFTLDGATPADTANCTNPQTAVGDFYASNQDPAGGSASGAIRCGTQWTAGPFTLPSGTYSVSLRGRANVTDVPNTTTFVEVPITTDGEIVVDATTARVQGTIVLAGAPPTEISCSTGELVANLEFRNASVQTITLPVRCGEGFAFDGRLFPGVYQVTVRGTAHSNLPAQRVVALNFAVTASVANLVFEAGEQTPVSGTLTIDGAAPTTAPSCETFNEGARVTFFAGDTVAAFANMSCNGPFTYAVNLPPGTYRVTARSIFNSGINEPNFQYSDLPPLAVGTTPVVYDVDVPLVDVTGALKLGGQTPVEDAGCTGNAASILFGLTSVPVPCGSGFMFGPIRMVPGTYGVNVGSSQSNLPANASVAVTVPPQGGPVVIDVAPEYELRLKFTVNGVTPDDGGCTSGEVARVNVHSATLSSQFPLTCGTNYETSLRVPAGSYEVDTYPSLSRDFPIYTHPTPITVQADTSVTIDIPTRPVSGQIMINGAVPVETAACTAGLDVAEVVFYNARTLASNWRATKIACGAGFNFGPIELAYGVYRVAVRPVGTGRSNLPTSEYVVIPRFEVQ